MSSNPQSAALPPKKQGQQGLQGIPLCPSTVLSTVPSRKSEALLRTRENREDKVERFRLSVHWERPSDTASLENRLVQCACPMHWTHRTQAIGQCPIFPNNKLQALCPLIVRCRVRVVELRLDQSGICTEGYRHMKFALVEGQRKEPQPGLSGECPACGNPMVARCGEIRVWHWAHRSRRHCDSWWENEKEWHRNWKDQFPEEWQEFVQHAEDGERHIADIKTDDEWVIEFQHSYIKPEERRSREGFYSKLASVVDGLRRKRDEAGFQKALEHTAGNPDPNSPGREIWRHEGALLKDWAESGTHVFFDFGEHQPMWWLSPSADDFWVYVSRVSRKEFIAALTHQGGRNFDSFVSNLIKSDLGFDSRRQRAAREDPPPRSQRDFEREFLNMGRRLTRERRGPRRFRR